MKRISAYSILFAGTLLWCFMLFIPVLVSSVAPQNHELLSRSYGMFSLICHQKDSHSIHLFGAKLGVCARCSCIYFGFLAGVFAFPFRIFSRMNNTRKWILIALAPMAIDVALSMSGIHESTMLTRVFTGVFFGCIMAGVLTAPFIEGYNEFIHQQSKLERTVYES